MSQDFRPVFVGLKYYLIHLLCKQFREIVRFSEDIRLKNSRLTKFSKNLIRWSKIWNVFSYQWYRSRWAATTGMAPAKHYLLWLMREYNALMSLVNYTV